MKYHYTEEMKRRLTRIRREEKPGFAWGMDRALVERLIDDIAWPILDHSTLQLSFRNHVRNLIRNLANLYRSEYGWDLAHDIETMLRDWQKYALEPKTAQLLVCEIDRRLASMDNGSEGDDDRAAA